jgi:hypothetical protein
MNTFDKLFRVDDDDVTAMRLANLGRAPRLRTMSDAELLRKGMARQIERQPHSVGSADPDRKRELGETEVDLGTERRRIRIAHDPENGAMSLHGVNVMVSNVDKDLADSFESTASRFMQEQGNAEQETQRVLLGLVVSAIMRRHQFLTAAVTQRLRDERYHGV